MEELGGYRLVAPLGEGGMGWVHLGRAPSGRLVAVKAVHEHLAADPRFRERFRREALAARAVTGPFTAAVLAADPEAVRPWLATEFCTGPTLTGAVSALGPLAPGELAALGAALAEAVAAVHAAGLVHRDLKPSNIVVTRDGPMVIDFGVARTAADETLTGSGEVVGSPGFIAPELLTGAGEPGPAVDVFALGALLAYAATGRPPFGTGPVHQVLYRTTHGRADLDGVPERWRELLGSCLAEDPGDRPAVAGVLAECAAWTEGAPWWEREAVAGLIRRREEEIAELVANAERAPAAGPVAARAEPARAEPAPARTLVRGGLRGASRRRFLRWGGAAIAGGAAVGAVAWLAELTGDDGQDGGAGTGAAGSPGPYTLGRALWTRDIGKAQPLRYGEALYLRDEDRLTRLDPGSGAVAWSYPAEDITEAVPGAALVHVLRSPVMSSTEIVTLDAATGVVRWSADPVVRNPHRPLRLRETPTSDPVISIDGANSALSVSVDVLCVVTYASYSTQWELRAGQKRPWRAYGYHPRTGAPLWFHQGARAEVEGLYQRGGRIGVASTTASLVTEENRTDEPLTVLRAADGTLEREIPRGARHPESYLGSRDTRYYATDGRLSAVDLATRRTLWSRDPAEEETDTSVTPTAHAGLVYAATYGSLTAIDADSGRTRWSLTDVGEPVTSPPLVSGGLVYGLGRSPDGEDTSDGRPRWGVHARDAATGALVWAAETGEVRTVLAGPGAGTRTGLIHVVSDDGTLSTFAAPEPT
ncbi:PQQ-binding-like beta-propeller repeat protein [Streptomyces niveus]|uniref:protein kinase domain-containing protein n=1 Tax=Streptomyces niveus TaxID=193462 RepID=UPI0036860FD2